MSLADKLLESYNNEYSISQKHQENLFFKILSILVTIFGGYFYIYTSFLKSITPEDNQKLVLSLSIVILTIVLMICQGIIINNAYGFRTDQLTIFKIRKHANLIGSKSLKIFSNNYNPVSSYQKKIIRRINMCNCNPWKISHILLDWLPNFHSYTIFTLGLVQVILLLSYIFNPYLKVIGLNRYFVIAVLCWTIFNLLVFKSLVFLKIKIEKSYKVANFILRVKKRKKSKKCSKKLL